jgi:excisionase family DNA binding protein
VAKLLTPAQVAEILNVKPRTLEDWRMRGTGPHLPFVRLGRTVRYRADDVEKAVEANVFARPEAA